METLHLFWPRASCLVALMMLQSLSSLVLAGFSGLVKDHPSIVFFLTMLVGTGGNVGGQSVVLAVRRLACGESVQLLEQFGMAIKLAVVLVPLSFARAWLQGTHEVTCLSIAVA